MSGKQLLSVVMVAFNERKELLIKSIDNIIKSFSEFKFITGNEIYNTNTTNLFKIIIIR